MIPTLTGSCTALSVARATCGEPTNDERIDKITYLIERVRFGSLAALLSSSFTALTLVRKPDPSIVESSLSKIVLLWRTTPSPRFQRSTLRGKYLSREEFFSSLSSFLMPGERREEKEEEKKKGMRSLGIVNRETREWKDTRVNDPFPTSWTRFIFAGKWYLGKRIFSEVYER